MKKYRAVSLPGLPGSPAAPSASSDTNSSMTSSRSCRARQRMNCERPRWFFSSPINCSFSTAWRRPSPSWSTLSRRRGESGRGLRRCRGRNRAAGFVARTADEHHPVSLPDEVPPAPFESNVAKEKFMANVLKATLGLLLSRFLDKDVVRDGVPGVMNANEEQQQRRRCNAKQGLAKWGRAAYCRYRPACVPAKGSGT